MIKDMTNDIKKLKEINEEMKELHQESKKILDEMKPCVFKVCEYNEEY